MSPSGTLKSGFQSTHPVRGATHTAKIAQTLNIISIHAPREGCDKPLYELAAGNPDFNPRTP